jgi:hypothetical protein
LTFYISRIQVFQSAWLTLSKGNDTGFLYLYAILFMLSFRVLMLPYFDGLTEVVSKPQITPKIKARADPPSHSYGGTGEKAQHTYEYVSILRRSATPIFGVRWVFATTSNKIIDAVLQRHKVLPQMSEKK